MDTSEKCEPATADNTHDDKDYLERKYGKEPKIDPKELWTWL